MESKTRKMKTLKITMLEDMYTDLRLCAARRDMSSNDFMVQSIVDGMCQVYRLEPTDSVLTMDFQFDRMAMIKAEQASKKASKRG